MVYISSSGELPHEATSCMARGTDHETNKAEQKKARIRSARPNTNAWTMDIWIDTACGTLQAMALGGVCGTRTRMRHR